MKPYRCRACGDTVTTDHRPSLAVYGALTIPQGRVFATHCYTCAMEIVFDVLTPTTLNHSTGGGVRVVKETKTH